MEFWYLLGGIVLALLLFPYLRLLFIRAKTSVKLRHACRKNGYTLLSAHPLPFLGRNNSGRPDFYIRANDHSKAYCVKLFGTVHRLSTLYLIEGDQYQWERSIPLAGRIYSIVHTTRTAVRSRKPVDYTDGFDESSVGRCIPVLLMCPAPMAVRRTKQILQRHNTTERPPMFTPRKEFETVVHGQHNRGAVMSVFDAEHTTDTLYDGSWVFNEYLFSTASFCAELFCSCIEA
ncbi:MAG: hypothetical protein ACI4V1_03490 [Eubacteriales bacterium]